MVILSKEQISPEVLKISSDTGSAFFIRTAYLTQVLPEEIEKDAQFFDEKEDDIINAGLIFGAERKALDYLSRAEQCRRGLTAKLITKNFEKSHIETALDYLEAKNYLSDRRFAESWLNTRKINHAEGRTKLSMELMERGISKEIIKETLDSFFEEISEEELCVKALEKCRRQKKSEEKTVPYLMSQGFSWKLIKQVMAQNKEE